MREKDKRHNYIVYEIFPKSFKDSNRDGAGDFKGITSKLDYLKWLGIDYIWLTPINKSPLVDGGYDVSDYYDTHEEFGTVSDFKELIREANKREIGIVMDIVINHTSDQHEWFQRAIKGEKKYQDYYFFRKGKNGGPPNNWKAIFGGSVWKYVPEIDMYYLHIFDPAQPDLNWNNEEVREEMAKMTQFWINEGVKGFRVDAIIHIGKPDLEDANPETYAKALGKRPEEFDIEKDWTATFYKFSNQPNFLTHFKDYKNRIKDADKVLWIGESSSASLETYRQLTNRKDNLLDLSCIFHHTGLHKNRDHWWKNMEANANDFYNVFKEWQEYLYKNDLTISVGFCSHDHARIVSTYGDPGKYRLESSKALGGFIQFLRGVPFIYFGEELGVTNHPFKSLSELDDIRTIGDYEDFKRYLPEEEAVKAAIANSRDHARTPMPWEDKEDLGWGSTNPWLPYNPANRKLSVEVQYKDPNSALNFFRKMIELRKKMRIIQDGSIEFSKTGVEKIIHFTRELGNEKLFVYLNLSKVVQELPNSIEQGHILVNNYGEEHEYKDGVWKKLQPFQFIVIHKLKM